MTKTTAAKCAQTIRKELKEKFPAIKFRVRSENFAGGNSVHIDYTDGVISDEVQKVVNKYQYGHFDGMTDCYEYSNNREDIPQVKYVQLTRNISEENRKWITQKIANDFGIKNIDDDNEWKEKFGMWKDQAIWREVSKLGFTN